MAGIKNLSQFEELNREENCAECAMQNEVKKKLSKPAMVYFTEQNMNLEWLENFFEFFCLFKFLKSFNFRHAVWSVNLKKFKAFLITNL